MKSTIIPAALLALAALGASPAAAATAIDYTLSGAGSGTMTLDYDGSVYSLDALNLTLGTATFTAADALLGPSSPPLDILRTTDFFGGCIVTPSTNGFCFSFDPSLASQSVTVDWSNTALADVQHGSLTITQVAGAVPEPASWAMLLLGLGAAGVVLRRRRGPQQEATAR